MPVEVILPKVDMDMTHGTLATWHVAEGDYVEKGAPLFDIETDKAAMEVEAPASGRLSAVTAQPGDRIPVGSVVAFLLAEGESAPVGEVVAATTDPATAISKAVEVILPKVDMDMTEGQIAVWHVAEGAHVEKGAPLFDIETDKAAMEVDAPASGVLQQVTAAPGDRVPVGQVIAYICPPGVFLSRPPQGASKPAAFAASLSNSPTSGARSSVSLPASPLAPIVADATMDGLRATPAARAEARRSAIALSDVAGTGPLGRIQIADVRRHRSGRSEAGPLYTPGWIAERGPLHVSRRSGDGAPIVLIHGFAADSPSWTPFERELRLPNPLIRIDLPGHGRSPKLNIASFAELAKLVGKTVDSQAESSPVHLIGHSLGGAIALAIADIRPKMVSTLSLLAPGGLGPEIDAAALRGIARASRVESLAPWLRRLTAFPEGVSDDYARAAMKQRMDARMRLYQADLCDVLFPDGVQSFDLRPAVGRLTTPTVMVWGKRDHILPLRQVLAVDGDFAIHLLNDTGHAPQIECPERLARIVRRHIVAATVSV
ncbi:pimeloyl-ACP methyl ester carboxylesterase/biotin carboxyl carrier protein [Rhizobium sp. SG_E_25_P2]|uniref:acetoin dehydrogenase dihydrolipoyllysine-residue acetyltransferase subunit n=1 Tax=Rhizobium sp. SG_E_25_P2 TaxID=2879942 RepID=UPI0024735218|nr:acetoin dehydrogenase dihydrolipoyllysine-residue acetyltransferase subunit [Rhizobium sp. SG_E_25_P2]MDH6265822.1 pimeloyl-ACP methyl ester carboxylesterase/biotin carboxyl carrier protein [Rhizobium sp. SG_E_25_P2]